MFSKIALVLIIILASAASDMDNTLGLVKICQILFKLVVFWYLDVNNVLKKLGF